MTKYEIKRTNDEVGRTGCEYGHTNFVAFVKMGAEVLKFSKNEG